MTDSPAVPVLELKDLVKDYDGVRAVDRVSFHVNAGEIVVIVGASGCGKTTTLRCIAGLEHPTEGEIRLDGKVIANSVVSVPPERRGIGMVFQSYALWPHKTAAQNVAYGLERRGIARAEATRLLEDVLSQVGLIDQRHRYPGELSGGQQQRVALARAAVLRPRLLLLDEPLSNLDAKLRDRMRADLQTMIRMFGMTAVHITHDQQEALALADRLVCMRAGRISQIGSPREVYRKPTNAYAASFLGAANVFRCEAIRQEAGVATLRIGSAELVAAAPSSSPSVCVVIRAEAVEFTQADDQRENTFSATVSKVEFLGASSVYQLDSGGVVFTAFDACDRQVGDRVRLRIDRNDVQLLPED